MKHTGTKRLCAVLLAACLACALALPGFAEDPQAAGAVPAAGPTVEGEVYDGTDYVQFRLLGIPAGTQYYCDLSYPDAAGTAQYVVRRAGCNAGDSEIGFDVPDAQQTYTFTLYTLDAQQGYQVAATAKSVTVYAVLGGTSPVRVPIALCAVGCDAAGVQTQQLSYTAPTTYYYSAGSGDYDLAGAADYALTAGQACEVPYTAHTAAILTGTVTFVDDTGAILTFNSTQNPGTQLSRAEVQVQPSDGGNTGRLTVALDTLDGVTKDAAGTYSITGADGNTYTVARQGLNTLVFSYYGALHYVVHCTSSALANEYYATIRYTNEAGALLFTDRVYIKQNYTYYAPTSFSSTSGGAVVFYETDAASAKLEFVPGAPLADRTRTIVYKLSDGTQPYIWSVRLINAQTGAMLYANANSIVNLTVAPAATGANAVTYTPAAKLLVDGTSYTLDASQMENGAPKTFTHAFGDTERVLYIYYLPEGYTRPASYDVKVQYLNVADGSVIYSTTVSATPQQDAVIDCPASYDKGGVTYLRLGGQPDSYTHSYNSLQRTYSIWYRDKNAPQYQNTIIYQVQVLTSEDLQETIIDRGVIDNGTYTRAAAGGGTVTAAVNNETGETALTTQNGTDTAAAREEIANNETPLANGAQQPGSEEAAQSAGFLSTTAGRITVIASLILLALLLAGIFLLWRRNRRDDSNGNA